MVLKFKAVGKVSGRIVAVKTKDFQNFIIRYKDSNKEHKLLDRKGFNSSFKIIGEKITVTDNDTMFVNIELPQESPEYQEQIYKEVLRRHVNNDACSRIFPVYSEDDYDLDGLADAVARAYVDNDEYDPNISYWSNIDTLINKLKGGYDLIKPDHVGE